MKMRSTVHLRTERAVNGDKGVFSLFRRSPKRRTASVNAIEPLPLLTDSRPSTRKLIREHWQLYVLLLIPMAQIIIFAYIPMVGAQIAFRDFSARGGIFGSPWVGLKHFQRFMGSYQFARVLGNTLLVSFYQLLAGFPIPIILALALHVAPSRGYRKVVQMATYLPYFISMVVFVGIIRQFLNPRIGVFGLMFTALTGDLAPDLLGRASYFPHVYVLSGIWQTAGWGSIIYLAVLSSVDPELHEAATIDGANRMSRLWHVDLPAIIPTAIVLLIMNTGRVMMIGFEKAFLLQTPLNLARSELISTYVYKLAFGAGADFSFSTAVGLFKSTVSLILVVIVNRVAKRYGGTSLW